MPDLETAAVRDWLREHEPAALSTLDVPSPPAGEAEEVLSALRRCGTALDLALTTRGEVLATLLRSDPARDELRQIMAQLGIGHALRLFWWVAKEDIPDPDAVTSALCTPDTTGSGQFLQATLAEAAQPALLTRLFAPERLADLLTASTQVAQMQEAA